MGVFAMKLPIYIDGKEEGALTIERQGAATVMRADMRDVGRVVRLTVYGERAWYLGVPAPENGRLRLTRRFSPLEMARFPKNAEYAAEKPMRASPEPPEKQTTEKPEKEPFQGVGRHVLWMGGKPYFF